MPCPCSASCATLAASEGGPMTATDTAGREQAASAMSGFERYLTVWVLLCIVVGIALGQFAPSVFQAIGRMEVARSICPWAC